MTNLKKILKNILIGLSLIMLSFIVLEAFVRLFFNVRTEPHPKNLYITDPDIGYRFNPNFTTNYSSEIGSAEVVINSQSMRDYKDYGKKEPETYRILLLGDSQVFAASIPLERTFGKILEKRLNENLNSSTFEVMNVGVPGYNTANELAFAQKYALSLGVDLVILCFYGDNDTNGAGIHHSTIKDGYLTSENENINPVFLPFSIKKLLRKHSHLYYFIMWNWATLRGKLYPVWKERFRIKSSDELESLWQPTNDILSRFQEWLKSYNVSFLVMNLPNAFQIEDYLKEQWDDDEPHDLTIPNKMIAKICKENGIWLMDLYPAFTMNKNEVQIYGKRDKHLTVEGHKLVGEELFKFLRQELSYDL